MNICRQLIVVFVLFYMVANAYGASEKRRIFVVSSYHREYLWSQSTAKGVSEAMLKYGYLDNRQQIEEFTTHDYVESSKAVVKKAWMDTKRKRSEFEIGPPQCETAPDVGAAGTTALAAGRCSGYEFPNRISAAGPRAGPEGRCVFCAEPRYPQG